MEYRIFDTIINVDKVLNEKQRKFIEMTANFIELILTVEEPWMALSMMKMGDLANTIKETTIQKQIKEEE